MSKPFAPSADRNKEPILHELQHLLIGNTQVLEIGSGTGQHACHFAPALPHVVWQPTELESNIDGIRQWLREHQPSNVLGPVVLDVNVHPWPVAQADVCFTCNTLHIVSESSVSSIFKGARSVLRDAGRLLAYGPFLVDGEHVGSGNEEFDRWLRSENPDSGVRDLSALDVLAHTSGFGPHRRIEMPANNFLVIWQLTAPAS